MKEANVQKNTLYNMIKSAAAILFPLISFPYAARVLLAEGIGKVNFGNSIISYFSLLATLGITTYAIRECAKVRDDKVKLEKTASQLFSINLLTTLLSYLLLALTLLFARPLADYRVLITIQASTILFTTLGTEWLNSAMEDFKFITLRTVLFQALSLALMFLLVKGPEDYLIYAGISVISSAGASLTNILYRRRFCRIRFVLHMDLKQHLPSIMVLFSLILSQTIYVNSDVTIIGLFRGDQEVGLYSTAVKIYNIVNTMVASVAFVVMPKLTYWYAHKDYTQINDLLRYGLGFIVTLGLPCIVGVNAVCADVIDVLAGTPYMAAAPALHILTLALLGSFLGGFVGNLILIPSGREKICLFTSLLSAGINLVLNLIFIPIFGFTAAAATTALAEITGFLISLRFVEKQVVLGNLKKLIAPPILGCAVMAAVIYLIGLLIDHTVLRLIISVCIGAAGYFAVLLLTKHEFTKNMLHKIRK